MLRKIIISGLCFLLLVGTGCSSSKVDDESEAKEETSEEASGDESGEEASGEETADADDEGEDSESSDDASEEGDDEIADDGSGDEEEDFAEEEGDAEKAGEDQIADEPKEEAPVADAGTSTPAEETPLPPSEPLADTSSSSSGSGFTSDETSGLDSSSASAFSEPVGQVGVKKIQTVPYTKNGVLVNAVYIARDGDSVSSISQKIYGSDKSSEILNINGHLHRGVKVGDKVYYNSPNRPTDSEKLVTYYEDVGLQPEVYFSKAGENIRTVSEKLLGHSRSWMEVYATNLEVDTKGEMAEGTQLKYWSSEAKAPPIAKNEPPPMETPAPPMGGETPPPPPMDSGSEVPPPPPVGATDVPPPPPSDEVPPPPPAVGSTDVPPPPPIDQPKRPAMAEGEADMEDPDQLMLFGGGALVLLALILGFVMIKKRRNRQNIDFNTSTHTHIE